MPQPNREEGEVARPDLAVTRSQESVRALPCSTSRMKMSPGLCCELVLRVRGVQRRNGEIDHVGARACLGRVIPL